LQHNASQGNIANTHIPIAFPSANGQHVIVGVPLSSFVNQQQQSVQPARSAPQPQYYYVNPAQNYTSIPQPAPAPTPAPAQRVQATQPVVPNRTHVAQPAAAQKTNSVQHQEIELGNYSPARPRVQYPQFQAQQEQEDIPMG
jgi:hypothetical protein